MFGACFATAVATHYTTKWPRRENSLERALAGRWSVRPPAEELRDRSLTNHYYQREYPALADRVNADPFGVWLTAQGRDLSPKILSAVSGTLGFRGLGMNTSFRQLPRFVQYLTLGVCWAPVALKLVNIGLDILHKLQGAENQGNVLRLLNLSERVSQGSEVVSWRVAIILNGIWALYSLRTPWSLVAGLALSGTSYCALSQLQNLLPATELPDAVTARMAELDQEQRRLLAQEPPPALNSPLWNELETLAYTLIGGAPGDPNTEMLMNQHLPYRPFLQQIQELQSPLETASWEDCHQRIQETFPNSPYAALLTQYLNTTLFTRVREDFHDLEQKMIADKRPIANVHNLQEFLENLHRQADALRAYPDLTQLYQKELTRFVQEPLLKRVIKRADTESYQIYIGLCEQFNTLTLDTSLKAISMEFAKTIVEQLPNPLASKSGNGVKTWQVVIDQISKSFGDTPAMEALNKKVLVENRNTLIKNHLSDLIQTFERLPLQATAQVMEQLLTQLELESPDIAKAPVIQSICIQEMNRLSLPAILNSICDDLHTENFVYTWIHFDAICQRLQRLTFDDSSVKELEQLKEETSKFHANLRKVLVEFTPQTLDLSSLPSKQLITYINVLNR